MSSDQDGSAAFFSAREELDRLPGGPLAFAEFFRARRLSLTAGVWRAGAEDPQTPHAEDEVYLIVSGRAKLRVDGADHDVREGMLIYVPARMEHRFHSIEADLETVVFWSPPRHAGTDGDAAGEG